MTYNRVVPKLAGRLGNHMFMVANAYTIAQKHKLPLELCTSYFENKEFYLDSIFRKIPTTNKILSTDISPSGYFQSVRYFQEFQAEIKELYTSDDIFLNEIKPLYSFLDFNKTCCVSVRRGDYLRLSEYHPVVSKEYLDRCMKLSKMKNFLFFSDDNQWCKDNFKGDNIYYCDNVTHAVRKMWLMSECKEHILSNSSYSWWGAFLSKENKGTVYCPATWYGPKANKSSWNEIYVPHWNIVATYYENGKILPI